MTKIYINEIYGPVFQGEGSSVGRQCMFVRLAGCPLHCHWCDSAYTWRFSDKHPHTDGIVYNKGQEVHEMEVKDLANHLGQSQIPMIVFTGGEPMVQRVALAEVIDYLDHHYQNYEPRFEIETAGIINPEELTRAFMRGNYVDYQFNVSPKLKNSGNSMKERFKEDILYEFAARAKQGKAIFKFVVRVNEDDIIEIENIVKMLNIPPEKVYLMPEGITQEAIINGTKEMEPLAREHGFNVSTRLHILVHGNKRRT